MKIFLYQFELIILYIFPNSNFFLKERFATFFLILSLILFIDSGYKESDSVRELSFEINFCFQ